MSSWQVAPAVKALFKQADLVAPSRSKAHDGTIGDTAHSARRSDHNPDASGWVYAGDLTDDDKAGIDCREIARQIVARRDRRVKYLIHEGRICGAGGTQPWVWRAYSGPNGHFKHLHVSVTAQWRSDTSPWWTAAATDEEDDMTPEQAKQLEEVHRMLKALVRPRRSDKADHDPRAVDLGDILTKIEKP